ncbi:marvel domain-containing protein [Xylaria venustula]|nr:marvel domain-containing protein [Xylaria venustula]
MLNIAAITLRAFLVIFSAIVLGLSVTLAKQQVLGSPPAETSFFSFAGAFGLVASAIAILGLIIDKIPRVGVIAFDVLSSIFYLAGAIALTIALKPVPSCTSSSDLARGLRYENKLLNGGCKKQKNDLICPNAGTVKTPDAYTSGRCQEVQADYVFGYLAFVFGAASVVVMLLTHRRGGTGTTTATYV